MTPPTSYENVNLDGGARTRHWARGPCMCSAGFRRGPTLHPGLGGSHVASRGNAHGRIRTPPGPAPVIRMILRFPDLCHDKLMCSHVRAGGSAHMGVHRPTMTIWSGSRNTNENPHSSRRSASVPCANRLRNRSRGALTHSLGPATAPGAPPAPGGPRPGPYRPPR